MGGCGCRVPDVSEDLGLAEVVEDDMCLMALAAKMTMADTDRAQGIFFISAGLQTVLQRFAITRKHKTKKTSIQNRNRTLDLLPRASKREERPKSLLAPKYHETRRCHPYWMV